MRRASFRWPKVPPTRKCSGCGRKRAASFRSMRSMSREACARPSGSGRFDIRIDTDFAGVIDACAEERGSRQTTWINAPIREAYIELFGVGHAHSVEAWREGRLVGGLYGVTLGRAFFGESMFSRRDGRVEGLPRASGRALARARIRAARHAVHHRAPQALRRDRRAAAQIREAAGGGAEAAGQLLPPETLQPRAGRRAEALAQRTEMPRVTEAIAALAIGPAPVGAIILLGSKSGQPGDLE